jgi:hypothetical protein
VERKSEKGNAMSVKTREITAENQFTDPIFLAKGFNVSIWGTFVGTVAVQRSFDLTQWLDVATYTAPAEDIGYEPEGSYYRAGVKSGEFVSGAVNVRVGK